MNFFLQISCIWPLLKGKKKLHSLRSFATTFSACSLWYYDIFFYSSPLIFWHFLWPNGKFIYCQELNSLRLFVINFFARSWKHYDVSFILNLMEFFYEHNWKCFTFPIAQYVVVLYFFILKPIVFFVFFYDCYWKFTDR